MDESLAILIIALTVLGYGFISNLISRFNISGPMVFMIVGVMISPLVTGFASKPLNGDIVQIVAEMALVIVLFSDASGLRLKTLKWGIPVRLLFIGLPLTIVFTAYVASIFFPNEMFTYILLMSLILAPTDAALGKAVVTDESVPEKIRSSINVESGLNDGIVFPMLVTVVAMIIHGQTQAQDNGWILFVGKQILFGAMAGAFIGYFSAIISNAMIRKKWMLVEYENLIPIALAVLSYYFAEYFGGNGFIAAFFAGLFVGNYSEDLREHVENFAESEGDLLIMISFVIFGLVFIPATIDFWNMTTFGFALLSLTVLRMLPVAISLIGTRFDMATVLFIGWFGPRGIASILYVLIVAQEIGSIKGHEPIYAVISLTIILSIFAHGISAQPFARLYAKNHKEEK